MTTWLREPLVWRRWQLMLAALTVGVACGVGIIVAVHAARGLADERSQRSADARSSLRRELEAKVATARAEARVAGRLARLERPTSADLERAIRRTLSELRRHPVLAGQLAKQLAAAMITRPGTTTRLPPVIPKQPARSSPPRRVRPKSPTSSPPSAPPAGGPNPGGDQPPVKVTTPTVTTPVGTLTVPSVCVRGVVAVNCP